MRDASPECIAYVNANNVAFRADLVTLVLANGTTHRWTQWGSSLTVTNYNRSDTQSFLAPPSAPIVEVGSENEDEGLSVCSLDITLRGQDFKVGGRSLPVLAADGYFDGAHVTLDHLIMPTAGDVSLKSFVDFEGTVDEPDIGMNSVTLRCKSWLAQLESTILPPRTYSPNCQWRLFGTECGLVEAANTTTGVVTAGYSATEFTANTVAHNHETYLAALAVTGFGSFKPVYRGWWDLGTITFTGNVTAALAGQRIDVLSTNSAGDTVLASAAAATPAVGDTFTITSGCHLDRQSCNRYSNIARFGGFMHIPPTTTTPVR